MVRWAWLAAILAAETAFLTLRFDTTPLLNHPGVWSRLLLYSHAVLQIGMGAGVAIAALTALRLRDEIDLVANRLGSFWRITPYVICHGAAFTVFVWWTAHVLAETNLSAVAFFGWIALAGLTLGFWAAALVPPVCWPRLARRGWGVGLAGMVIGATAWSAGKAMEQGWEHSGGATLWVVSRLLGLFFPDAVVLPDGIVGTSSFLVEIASQCSGYEGMGLIVVFLLVYLWLFRRDLRFPHALLLLPLGVLLAWLANIGRIVALVAVGTWGSPELARGGFHSQLGWLLFLSVSLGLVAVTRRTKMFGAVDTPTLDHARPANSAAAYLVPLLAVVAVQMITAALSTGFDRFYPLRMVVALAALLYFRPAYAGWRLTWSWQAAALGVAAFAVWMALEFVPFLRTNSSPSSLGTDLAGLAPWAAVAWLACRVLGSVVIVPFVEELAFRGYLTRRLIAADFLSVPPGTFTWLSFLLSSVIFGALHGRWLAGLAAGMLYALSYYRRGRLMDAVLAHGVTNALIAAYVLGTGDWGLWS
jgi:exosortase E/protease (VPEID-CTERM system)